MRKIIVICLLLISGLIGFSQSVVQRSNGLNTLDDPNGMNSRSKIIPRYQDTTEANTKYNTLDSAGKIIYTRSDKSFWYRQDYPKKWVRIVSDNNLSDNFFFDSTCNCYKIDTTSLMNIINNFTGDSSITNISILNDSTIRICYGNGTCVDIGIVTNITNINNIQFLNDSTIIVCNVDTTDVNTQTCDTIVIGRKSPILIYQNGVRFHDNIVEFGDDMSVNGGFQQPGMLRHNTTLDFLYNTLRYQSAKVYDYGFQVNKYPNFGFENGTGLQSWLHENNSRYPNVVRLGVNYTDSSYGASPSNLIGYFGDRTGYFLGTNATGYGSYGLLTDNANSKVTGILFHTTDTSHTDAVTIYGKQYPNISPIAPIATNGTMLPYRITTFNTDKSIIFHGYNSSNFQVSDTGRYKPMVVDSVDGSLRKGEWVGGSNVNYGADFVLDVDSLFLQGAWVNVKDFGAVGDGVTNDYNAFVAAVATGKNVFVPLGTFLVNSGTTNGLALQANQRVFGAGKGSVIKVTQNGVGFFLNDYNIIEGLKFLGSGKGTGNTLQTLVFSYQMKGSLITKCFFENSAGDGSNPYYGGGVAVASVNNSTPFFQGVKISDCIFYNNGVGVYFSNGGEYCSLVNSTLTDNDVGVWLTGGNYSLANNHVDGNVINLKIISLLNSGHGTIASCTFNHASSKAFEIDGIIQGQVFTNCKFYFANSSISNSKGIIFDGCDFSTGGFGYTLTLTANTNLQVSNGRFPISPTSGAIVVSVVSGEDFSYINNQDF